MTWLTWLRAQMTWGEFGQLMAGIGIIITALTAVVTLTVISIHQKRKQSIDDFRALYAEFWRDDNISRVRRWIVSDRLYNQTLKPALIKRNKDDADLNEHEAIAIDNVDKFIAILIRLETLKKTGMPRRRGVIQRLLFSTFWKKAARSRSELKTYI